MIHPPVLLTLCTINQLPRAFALARSFCRHTSISGVPPSGVPPSGVQSNEVLIGLADDPDNLPGDFVSPYPLLFLCDILPASQLAALSGHYTPVEFVAACKPLFIAKAFSRYPRVDQFIYADPNIVFLGDTVAVSDALSSANIVLTPHLTNSPAAGPAPARAGGRTVRPAESHLQNVGLYSSDFMGFRRSEETRRMLAWWQDRVTQRARIDFCAGLCLDQLWLMHVPVFFRAVVVVKNPGWHVALWNLFDRRVLQTEAGWRVQSPDGTAQPLLFVNTKGLLNPDEGLFTQLDQPAISQQPGVVALMQYCRSTLAGESAGGLTGQSPAYGARPMPVILRGWRHRAVQSLRAATGFVDRVPLPSVR